MEIDLFKKIKLFIDEKNNEKNEVLFLIKEKTGIEIKEDQIEIKNKKITLYLNSNQKINFIKKDGFSFLKEKGYEI